MNFKEWLKIKEMAGTNAIVTKKDCNNPDFQIQGAVCNVRQPRKEMKNAKSFAKFSAKSENYLNKKTHVPDSGK